MRILLSCIIISGMISSTVVAQTGLDSEEGFQTIFNGENWDEWYLKLRNGDTTMAKKVFTIEDGIVHVFRDTPDSLFLNDGSNATHGMMYYDQVFTQYIMRFEYKWGDKIANNFDQFQYDAGFYYHCYEDGVWPKGLEYQIRYDHIKDENHTGDFWASNVIVDKWYADQNGAYLSPDAGGELQPVKKGEHKAKANVPFHSLNGEWNQCEAIVMGDQYAIHKLNDVIVNVGLDLSHGQGLCGFQSETAEIFYRNIRVKVLDEFIPMERFLGQ